MGSTVTHPIHGPTDGSDGVDRPFEVIVDRATAAKNRPIPLIAPPDDIDFRNRRFWTRKFATALMRSAMVHTASGGTAKIRFYAWSDMFQFGPPASPTEYQHEGLFIAEATITYAGGIVWGRCPIMNQAIVTPQQGQNGDPYDNSALRWYKASSVSWDSQYSTAVIETLRTTTTVAAAEVQTIDLDSASGGTYTLTVTVNGVEATTAALAYNANDAAVQAALQALSNVGSGGITVSSLACTFAAHLAAQEHPLITLDKTSLTGGGGGATVTRTTAGLSPEAWFRLDLIKNAVIAVEPITMSGSRVLVALTPWQG